jgi:hypothetical protein
MEEAYRNRKRCIVYKANPIINLGQTRHSLQHILGQTNV